MPTLTPAAGRGGRWLIESHIWTSVATPEFPKAHPYYSHHSRKPPLQSTGTDRHLQSIIQRLKPKAQAPAVSHRRKEPLATGKTESQEQMGSDGDTAVRC